MTSPTSAADAVTRLRTPAEILAALPHLVGFVPQRSVVAVALHGGGRVGVTMRVDLPSHNHNAALAAQLAARLAHDGATSALLVVYSDEDRAGGRLPRDD